MKKHSKKLRPDQTVRVGPAQISRYGETIVTESLLTEEGHRQAIEHAAGQYGKIVADIDGLVSEVRSIIVKFNPLNLLQRSYFEYFYRSVIGGDREPLERLCIEYIQSVVASTTGCSTANPDISDAEWDGLCAAIKKLYETINPWFHVVRSAQRQKAEGVAYDPHLDWFYVRAQIEWTIMRGARPQVHQIPHLRELLSPHDAELQKLFGIGVEELLTGVGNILTSLTAGLGTVVVEFDEFRRKTLDKLSEKIDAGAEGSPQELMAEVINENGWEGWKNSVLGRFFGFDLFALDQTTTLPESLLHEWAWEIGEEGDFFAPGDFSGWPLRYMPIMSRPFLKVDDKYYCFDVFNLFDRIYRSLQKTIKRLDPDYEQEWTAKQKTVSETAVLDLFRRSLPGCTVRPDTYYKFHRTGTPKARTYEVDGLVAYDQTLLIVEVKAGSFSWRDPTTDFASHITSLQNLLATPCDQGHRFIEYLKTVAEVDLLDEKENVVGKMRLSDYKSVIVCAVSLDSFTALAAQAGNLKVLGVDVSATPVWSLSLDDLRVYADVFRSPTQFLHLLDERIRAFSCERLRLCDEWDHIGLYLKHNRYVLYAEDLDRRALLDWNGYEAPLNEYYQCLVDDPASAVLPRQDCLHPVLWEIIEVLDCQRKAGSTELGKWLLDFGGEERQKLGDGIVRLKQRQSEVKRPIPFAVVGDHALVVFCQVPNISTTASHRRDYCESTLLPSPGDHLYELDLEYDAAGKLIDVSFVLYQKSAIKEDRRKELAPLTEKYAQSRIKSQMMATTKNKIGRNERCPCGSGAKYKRCHGQ